MKLLKNTDNNFSFTFLCHLHDTVADKFVKHLNFSEKFISVKKE